MYVCVCHKAVVGVCCDKYEGIGGRKVKKEQKFRQKGRQQDSGPVYKKDPDVDAIVEDQWESVDAGVVILGCLAGRDWPHYPTLGY